TSFMDETKPSPLIDLCLNAVGKNGRGLTPQYLRVTPRHLLMQILQSLNPFDLERLEDENIRSVTGIDTDSLWQLHYCQQWRHKGRWPESYYQVAKSNSRLPEKIPWRLLYWQRHFQEVVNSTEAKTGESSRKCNKTLKTLILRENCYESSHDNSLAVLLKHGKLTELDISFCGLEVVSGDVISSLGQNSSLKILNIAGNRLGDSGISALSQVFSQLGCVSSLSKLDLSYNQGTATSIGILASALHKFLPKRLEEINLAGNFLGSSISKVVSSIRPL
ncbi:hypothetical protein QZH41_015824, partial [Actinostola sp. cb2023]